MNATPVDRSGAPDHGHETESESGRVHVVVTAGPTREHLDDVRFLTNASTGRMGHEIARVAARRRARVTLILGPSDLPPLEGVETVDVVSTQDLLREARKAGKDADLVIFAAAPSDWRPARRRRGKPPRKVGDLEITLRSTPDVARSLRARKGDRIHVGFALEVGGGEHRARMKMADKGFDAIVLNGLENLGTGGGEIQWIPREGAMEEIDASSKTGTAREIVKRAWALLEGRAT